MLMEYSTIALIIWLLFLILLAGVTTYCICGGGGNTTSLHHLHLEPPPPPSTTYNTRTETKSDENNDPWFLVVYADMDERNYTVVAAEDILDFQFSGKRGEMRIHCKEHNGFPDNAMRFENINHYEFQRASQLGDYRDMEE